ncbi:MAG: hypothetical protein JNN15_03940 [Blastocatellia bacterium]|nr:hypothetical protein [Blastocatellia bacterium]
MHNRDNSFTEPYHTNNPSSNFDTICLCCESRRLDTECNECGKPACDGWYGNCCQCGHDYVKSFID